MFSDPPTKYTLLEIALTQLSPGIGDPLDNPYPLFAGRTLMPTTQTFL